ncbi:hypothetical protein [Nocardia arthritidis]|uniref:hypothetical protein n=1 Tax=Nocardia arthritidis TaxID=228602 RepID=UPI00142DF5C3|nr:hypothetical protein [Nocardia arthritidis]
MVATQKTTPGPAEPSKNAPSAGNGVDLKKDPVDTPDARSAATSFRPRKPPAPKTATGTAGSRAGPRRAARSMGLVRAASGESATGTAALLIRAVASLSISTYWNGTDSTADEENAPAEPTPGELTKANSGVTRAGMEQPVASGRSTVTRSACEFPGRC